MVRRSERSSARTPRLPVRGFALAAAATALASAGLFGCATLSSPTAAEIAAMPLTEVLALADRDNGLAQHQLCYGYSYGTGVQQDYARAFEWCSRASQHAELGSSQTLLGDLYLHGRGVEANVGEAHRWYGAAAATGHSHAQFMLGMLFEQGRGVEADIAAARSWYEQAAAGGSTLARNRLAKLGDK